MQCSSCCFTIGWLSKDNHNVAEPGANSCRQSILTLYQHLLYGFQQQVTCCLLRTTVGGEVVIALTRIEWE